MLLDQVNILLVDDHEPNLIALEQILEAPAISIHKATSGQNALEHMLTHEYALVLLDVNMPEMDGFEVARLMKARQETRHLPICFVTAVYKDKGNAMLGYEAGAVDYLYKPLDTDIVKSKVSVFVELFRLRKQSENRLKAIESSIDGIAIFNRDMRFTFANAAFLTMNGYQDERQLSSLSYMSVLDQNSVNILNDDILPALDNTGRWHGELQCKRVDGTRFPASVSLNRTNLDTIGIFRDITKRKAAQEHMRMLQCVVENANDMVVVTDPGPLDAPYGPKIRYVNPAFERITGYSKHEVIGKAPRFLQGEATDQELLKQLKQALQRGEQAHIEVMNYTKDGRAYYNDIRIVPVRNHKGQLEFFNAIQRDTTARRRIEEDLKRANKELETFTYITSHDMRSPLVNLKGFCSELEEGFNTLRPAIECGISQLPPHEQSNAQITAEKYIPAALNYIKQGTQKLDLITGLLLELSRTGRRELHYEQITMKHLVEHSLAVFGHQIKERNITVTVGDLPDVVADQRALQQVFSNLLDNAIKYLEPARPGEIAIWGTVNGAETTYAISDNGRGIAQNQMHKVFEVFRRVGDVGHIPGEGMGIAFIKTLLYRHRGRIWCESEVEQGTTFFFSIAHHLAA